MSQIVLAHRAGCHPHTISNLERGLTMPSLVAVFALAGALEVHPRDILFGEEE
jgi:transcriptional regulator with XRE-family HTH domain